MAYNDAIIERWLEEELDQEESLDLVCSDEDINISEDYVLGEQSGSDSEIEGEPETNSVEDNSEIRPLSPFQDFSSSDDDIPLQQLRSRPRKKNYTLVKIVFDGHHYQLLRAQEPCSITLFSKGRAYIQLIKIYSILHRHQLTSGTSFSPMKCFKKSYYIPMKRFKP